MHFFALTISAAPLSDLYSKTLKIVRYYLERGMSQRRINWVVMQGGKSEGDMSVTGKIPCLHFCGGPKPVVSNVLGTEAK